MSLWSYYTPGCPTVVGAVVVTGYQYGWDQANGVAYPLAGQQQLTFFYNINSQQISPFNARQWSVQQRLQSQPHVPQYPPSSFLNPPISITPPPRYRPQVALPARPYLPQTTRPISTTSSSSASPLRNGLWNMADITGMAKGPPRKPKQSGFALWVGNIPSDTQLEEMKDFFALDGIESISLIRKSNCAFVNYNTRKAAEDALAAFDHKGTTD